MIFSSPIFLFLFLPCFLLIYYISPRKTKNLIILLFSLLFYTWGEKHLVALILFSSIVDYICGIVIQDYNRKLGLSISIVSNLSILFVFKYLNFTIENLLLLEEIFKINVEQLKSIKHIALPIGISFYTFQTLSYSIDVYRGKIKASRNFIDFATYVCMFPQLVAGPIVRYADINKELNSRTIGLNDISIGIERFIIGLGKKVIIADTFAFVADEIFALPNYSLNSPVAWLGILSYSFQIFYDFSGYSDMAIGLGRMMGFRFLENFNYPYISKSIREFWRRWHISLSLWFRDYLYISLGGNRKGTNRTYINLAIVFIVTGVWHGANWTFIIWGLFHGLFLIIERMGFDKVLMRSWKPVQHIYALLVIVIGWVFFRSTSLDNAIHYLTTLFNFSGQEIVRLDRFINYETAIVFVFAIINIAPNLGIYYTKLKAGNQLKQLLYYIILLTIFIVSIIYVSASSYSPFIYYRF